MKIEQSGFALCVGKNLYFLESDKQKRCKSVVDAFINSICDKRKFCNDLRERFLKDENTRADIFDKMYPCTYKFVTTENGFQYHHFEEEYSIMNFPLNDCDEVIFL